MTCPEKGKQCDFHVVFFFPEEEKVRVFNLAACFLSLAVTNSIMHMF